MLRLRSLLAVLVSLAFPCMVLAQTAIPSSGDAPPPSSSGGFTLLPIIVLGLVALVVVVVAYRRARSSGDEQRRRATARAAVAVVVGWFGALAFAFGQFGVSGVQSGNIQPDPDELFAKIRLAGLAGVLGAAAIMFAPQLMSGVRRFLPRGPGSDKTCPDCAETVKPAARKCRFCGYRFDEGAEQGE